MRGRVETCGTRTKQIRGSKDREKIVEREGSMVLWEITLGIACFLGLKRTYRHAFRIQRRIVSTEYPRIRQFLNRRTRAVFDVTVKIHQYIKKRDKEVGRNFGNFILRWLGRMKPSPQIRGSLPSNGSRSRERVGKHFAADGSSNQKAYGMFTSLRTKHFPSVTRNRIMRPFIPARTTIHGRQFSASTPQIVGSNYRVNCSGGVIRKDIMQWMLHR